MAHSRSEDVGAQAGGLHVSVGNNMWHICNNLYPMSDTQHGQFGAAWRRNMCYVACDERYKQRLVGLSCTGHNAVLNHLAVHYTLKRD